VPAQQAIQPRPLRLRTYTEDMADNDFGSVTFRMVETQGLGDNLDNREHIEGIVKYVEGQFDEVLAEESRIRRNPRFTDSRVHAVVYMIEATGHGLREQDVQFMQRVSSVANIIPVLAKSDSLTPAEVLTNKRLVYEDIEHYKIPIYQFYNENGQRGFGSQKSLADDDYNFDDNDEPNETYLAMRKLQESLPFAVIASDKSVQTGNAGQRALVREYPWGILNIEDPKISDFSTLKDLLLYSHMEDLKETTNDILYERYRTLRLSEDPGFNAAVSAANAPITASRANLASVVKQPAPQPPQQPQPSQQQPAPVNGNPYGYNRQSSAGSARGSNYNTNSRVVSGGGSLYGGGSRVMSGTGSTYGGGSRVSSSSAHNPEYVSRENRLIEEEELLHRDEKLVQDELEVRRQELRRRELELKRLEEKLRQDAQLLQQTK